MGDRANIVVKEGGGEVFLYTHWGGTELPDVLKVALEKRWRWNDASYLARIIFCEMIKGQENHETGFGISTSPPDNSYPYIVVDVEQQEVRFENPELRSIVLARSSFEEYIASSVGWPKEHEKIGKER